MRKYIKARETLSKKDCNCSACGKQIKKGMYCIVDPKEKTAKHIKCK